MAQQVTLREMIAHRPLVYAWVWEMLCVAGAIWFGALKDNVWAMFGLVLAGALPFAVVLVTFLRAHRRGEPDAKGGSIVE